MKEKPENWLVEVRRPDGADWTVGVSMPDLPTRAFTHSAIGHHDGHWDRLLDGLPAGLVCPKCSAGAMMPYTIAEPKGLRDDQIAWSYAKMRAMAEPFLGMFPSDRPLLWDLFIRGATFSPFQVEDLIARTVRREDTGLLRAGLANLFFCHIDGPASVFLVCCYESAPDKWDIQVFPGNTGETFSEKDRVFFRRLDLRVQ